MQIDGQIALVTGAGSGLGAATARLLAARGAKVAVLDFDGAKANAVAAEIGGFGVQADVGSEAAVAAAFDAVKAHFGASPRVAVTAPGSAWRPGSWVARASCPSTFSSG
jgi:Short-chain alcohol dehydrogenase of unknown specificity